MTSTSIALRPEPDAHQPRVFARDGRVFANSQDVAAHFAKRHDHVLRQIRELVASGCAPNFGETSTTVAMPNGGTRDEPSYDMDRDGFALLVMSFTGKKALAFKVQYIGAFNAMEAELRDRPARLDLLDPASVRAALLEFSTRLVEVEAENAVLAPKALALDRISVVGAATCLRDAAKHLHVRPVDLVNRLLAEKWLYRRHEGGRLIASQDKIDAGLMAHRETLAEDSTRTYLQAVVTAKGRTKLAEALAASPATTGGSRP
jgi:Rha family phage regulatory protein